MTSTEIRPGRTAADDYATIRSTVGVYQVGKPLVRLTGDDRYEFIDQFASRSSEYVDPETVREVIALNDDGTPFAMLLHIEIDDVTWLLPRTEVTAEQLAAYLGQFAADDVTVEVAPDGFAATAFEGPQAWKVAAKFIDFDVSGLVLHGVTDASVEEAGTAFIARVGTTGEYGYLLVSDAPAAAHDAALSAASSVGGSAIGPDGLARVQAEAGQAIYQLDLSAFSVNDADLAWMIDWNRVGEFHGSTELVAPTVESARLVALVAPAGTTVEPGDVLNAGGVEVGDVVKQTPSANPAEELVIALVQNPFWVPGVALTGPAGQALTSVTMPRVIAESMHVKID